MGLEGLLTGHLLCDRYRVERVVGRGGMGAVYCATDVRLERGVAVKVITVATADVATRVRLRSRFHREGRAAARLQHPNVVTVYDFGTDTRLDLDFLVMELLRGEDMAKRLQRSGAPDLATGLEIMEQAARGIAAGHQVGLVHRDVKPGNFFLVEAGNSGRLRVCVLDFGIVQLTSEDEEATATHLTVAGRSPHSPAYAAPEQLQGESRLTPACDVWGLGATAFQILTGERPFTDAEQRRMMDGMSVPAPSARARVPQIPEAVDDLLRISLSHRPADRFRDAAAFANAIADARRGVAPRIVVATVASPRESPLRRDEDDRTLLDPAVQAQPRSASGGSFSPRPLSEPTRDGTLLDPALADLRRGPSPAAPRREPLPQRPIPAAVGAASSAVTASRAKRRWLRRALSTLWQLMITLAAIVAAGAFGAAMFEAFYNDLTEPFYASLTGLTLTVPWAVHRLLGRRGSYPLALIFCIGVAFAVFRFLAPLVGPEPAMMTLVPAQVLGAAWIARMTRRPREDDVAALPHSAAL
jgi:serine/threonine protein kinase